MRQKKRKTTEKETPRTITSDIVVCFFASDLMHNPTAYVIQEARVALGYCLGQLLRFFRALQTSHVLHNSIVHAKA